MVLKYIYILTEKKKKKLPSGSTLSLQTSIAFGSWGQSPQAPVYNTLEIHQFTQHTSYHSKK